MSSLTLSGQTKTQWYPLAWATIARPTPVLPEVGSTIVPPGCSSPDASAASTIRAAIRSFTEPPGLRYSTLASTSGDETASAGRSRDVDSRTSGVLPTRSSRDSAYSMRVNISAQNPLACIGDDEEVDVDSPASRTALGAARHRAVHQVVEGGSVFRDPLAVGLLGLPEAELREHAHDWRMRFFICARQRYAEDVLADAVAQGVGQLVVLGAGLDTFGYRNPYPELRVVELDHPATQAWKRERLAAAGIEVPAHVTHAPIDFERDALDDVLAAAVDTSRPVLFWWLGVTPYLTLEAITATLRTLGSLAHAAVVLDHGAPNPDATEEARAWTQARAERVAALGEPWITRFVPDDLARLLSECGFEHTHLEDEVALIRRLLDRPDTATPGRRVTHLALATRGWSGRPEVAQAERS